MRVLLEGAFAESVHVAKEAVTVEVDETEELLDRQTLGSYFALNQFYRDIGEHNMAMTNLKRCLARQTVLLGAEDEDTLACQQYVGEYLTFLGDSSEAVRMLEACVATHRQRLAAASAGAGDEVVTDCGFSEASDVAATTATPPLDLAAADAATLGAMRALAKAYLKARSYREAVTILRERF